MTVENVGVIFVKYANSILATLVLGSRSSVPYSSIFETHLFDYRLIVKIPHNSIEPVSSTAPKIPSIMSKPYNMPAGVAVSLLCPAQGFPAPNFRLVLQYVANFPFPTIQFRAVNRCQLCLTSKIVYYHRTGIKYSSETTGNDKKTDISATSCRFIFTLSCPRLSSTQL